MTWSFGYSDYYRCYRVAVCAFGEGYGCMTQVLLWGLFLCWLRCWKSKSPNTQLSQASDPPRCVGA